MVPLAMRGLNQARRLVGSGLLTPPVLCDRGSPSPRPSLTWGPPVANGRSGDPRRTKQIATKAAGIRGRSRPTLQHASLHVPRALQGKSGVVDISEIDAV